MAFTPCRLPQMRKGLTWPLVHSWHAKSEPLLTYHNRSVHVFGPEGNAAARGMGVDDVPAAREATKQVSWTSLDQRPPNMYATSASLLCKATARLLTWFICLHLYQACSACITHRIRYTSQAARAGTSRRFPDTVVPCVHGMGADCSFQHGEADMRPAAATTATRRLQTVERCNGGRCVVGGWTYS